MKLILLMVILLVVFWVETIVAQVHESNKTGSYTLGPDGKYYFNTNTSDFWTGTWCEDTNGFRVQISISEQHDINPWIVISFVSV